MKGYILTRHQHFKNATAQVELYGRQEDGKSFQIIQTYTPYFYIKTSDLARAQELLEAEFISGERKNLSNEPVTQVRINNPQELPIIRSTLEREHIVCYEADIALSKRLLLDNEILSCINIQGEAQPGEETEVRYLNPIISPVETVNVHLKILSIDIETDKDAATIYSIALVQDEYEEVIIVNNKTIAQTTLQHATIVENEEELLTVFFARLRELDSDVLVGWHVIDFDFDLIAKRAKHYHIPFLLGRSTEPARIRIEQSFFRESKVYAQGRVVLDGIHMLKAAFVKLEDYKLNTAAKELLGDAKLIEEDDRFAIIDNYYYNDPQHFIDYNLKDAHLVLRILDKSGVFNLALQRSILTGMPIDRVQASIASFDSLYMTQLRKQGYVAPSSRTQEREEGMGGFVMTSKPGLYKNVLVLDFKSLYPSIIRTFNIDPLAFVGDESEIEEPIHKETYIVAPNDAVLKNEESILPKLITQLWAARENARKQGNELARYAIKILMNSMYGVLASPNSRFHNRKLSNVVGSFGQYFIKYTATYLQEQGYEVIYGDTDSVFVNVHTPDEEEAQTIGKHIQEQLNTHLKEFIATNYARESALELEFEKLFLRFYMPTIRGSSAGAKKRYAGLRKNDQGKEYLDVTGLEIVRSDWTDLAKEFQEQLLLKIFHDQEIDTFIQEFVQQLREGKFDKLLIYKKSLRKPLEQYTKTTPPHVKAARLLDTIESKVISYVITKEGPQPIQQINSPIDYEHYVEKQIQPVAQGLLEVIGKDFETIINKQSQTGLRQFM